MRAMGWDAGGWVGTHLAGTPGAMHLLAPRSHILALVLQVPAPLRPPFLFQPPGAQLSNPSPPPRPTSPHLDQLDLRFEPLQAGLQGAQRRGGGGAWGQGL